MQESPALRLSSRPALRPVAWLRILRQRRKAQAVFPHQERIGLVAALCADSCLAVQAVQVLRPGLALGDIDRILGPRKASHAIASIITAQDQHRPQLVGLAFGQLDEQPLDALSGFRPHAGV